MSVKLNLGGKIMQLGDQNPRVLIGRDENSCELWIHDNSVSRRHAEVYLSGGQAFIRDLGSSNGVWIDMTPDDGVHNPQPVGTQPVALQPRWKVWVGQAPLGVEWVQESGGAATVMVSMTPELLAQMTAHKQQIAQRTEPPAMPAPVQQAHAGSPAAHAQAKAVQAGPTGSLEVSGNEGPSAGEMAYRRQGSNNNGTLLIALPRDTFSNENTINGFLEFTPTDNETIVSIFVELVEKHKKGPKKGHVWDRHLVRQGPWKVKKPKKNDLDKQVVPMPFQLRVPSGPSISSPDCHWEIRGYVDINWALDIEAKVPITMRNTDIEKIRDALGSLDYRFNKLDAKPLGQKYTGTFNPPAHLKKKLNITDVHLDAEYLGTNLKIIMEVEKSKLFHFDKKHEFVFSLDKLRAASRDQVAVHFQTEINKLMNV